MDNQELSGDEVRLLGDLVGGEYGGHRDSSGGVNWLMTAR